MIHAGDAITVLRTLDAGIAQMCVTSPPYWAQRDYGIAGQIGIEKSPEQYIANLVAVFREVRRVLADDGTLWVNIGDTFINAKGRAHGYDAKQGARRFGLRPNDVSVPGYKRKDLVGIPWMLAFALRTDGWFLRSDIIWSKPNATPDPVADRPQRAHEHVFLFAKQVRYFCDSSQFSERSVWTIPVSRQRGVQTATFPHELPRRCIAAGSRAGSLVLDPFAGSGTTGVVAADMGRGFIGIELNHGSLAGGVTPRCEGSGKPARWRAYRDGKREALMSWRRGWLDGAKAWPARKEFVEHETRPDLKEAYLAGHARGILSREIDTAAAMLAYDYRPEISDILRDN
jgi:site-specific DNA-methyltransferase (cytosine-N4-specific)